MKIKKDIMVVSIIMTLLLTASGCGINSHQNNSEAKTTEETFLKEEVQKEGSDTFLTAFDLKDVIVTDDYYQNSLDLEVDYLLELDADRLLAGFRETAGLDTQGKSRYSGWESLLMAGHTMGHYLTAVAQAYVNDAVSEEDKGAVYEKLTSIVDGLLECQVNSKGKTGFIFGAPVLDKNNVEFQFDNVEVNKTNIGTQAWVPWYTMYNIISGLVEVYELTGYEPAKTVVSSLADWVYDRTSNWSEETQRTVLNIEYGGMNECMYEVYKITGNEHHAAAAHMFDETALFEKILADTENALNNLHANTTIPKFLGALNRYSALGESESIYLEYAKSFWDMVVNKHTYITGGNSEWEHFGADYVLDAERTNCTAETCNTYNMLKLSKSLYEITGDVKYADYYEETLINAILSSQNPETGMSLYFQPMASGYFKAFGSEFDHFWCCTGTGMENFTKLNDGIYFYTDSSITVNRYVSSVVNWEEKNLSLIQTADIPNSSLVEFEVKSLNGDNEVDVQLRLRVPDYSAGDITVMVSGVAYDAAIVDNYLLIDGPFANGTVISITIPMQVKAYGLPDNDNVYALKYGPVVLSAELGTESMTVTTTGVNVSIPETKKIAFTNVVIGDAESTVKEFMENINEHLVKSNDSLTFTLKDTDQTLKFTPYYQQYQQRYAIYLSYKTAEELKSEDGLNQAAEKERLEVAKLDTVQPGYGQYENDSVHDMQENNSVGTTSEGTSRYAKAGGYFTYQMMVAESGPTYLRVTLKAADNGKSLKVAVGNSDDSDETIIYENVLEYSGDEEYYDIIIPISAAVVQENSKTIATENGNKVIVPITFKSGDEADSAAVCNFLYTYKSLATDSKVVYFVDCGDVGVATVSDGDSFGSNNSVTDQVYKQDTLTGYHWGIVDDPEDALGGSEISSAVFTTNTWAYEFITEDDYDKTETNRYTKNQYENGITTRYLDYAFELANGTYEVEVGFADPWGCSTNPSVYANIGTESEVVIADTINVKKQSVASAIVTVTDGKLTINARGEGNTNLAINMTYIIVRDAN